MSKKFGLKKIIIAIVMVLLLAIYIITIIRGKAININDVLKISVTENNTVIVYEGENAKAFLTSLNQKIRVKKDSYSYNELQNSLQIVNKELAKRASEVYYNKISKHVKHSFKLNASQACLFDVKLNKKQRKALINVLGVDWFNVYSVSQKKDYIVPPNNSVHFEFYPFMKYSKGNIDRWYNCSNYKNIKICLEQKEVETYSPKYIIEKGERILSGVFKIIEHSITD